MFHKIFLAVVMLFCLCASANADLTVGGTVYKYVNGVPELWVDGEVTINATVYSSGTLIGTFSAVVYTSSSGTFTTTFTCDPGTHAEASTVPDTSGSFTGTTGSSTVWPAGNISVSTIVRIYP